MNFLFGMLKTAWRLSKESSLVSSTRKYTKTHAMKVKPQNSPSSPGGLSAPTMLHETRVRAILESFGGEEEGVLGQKDYQQAVEE